MTATSALESRFDPFLYAAVREGADGTPVTVLSILARLDIDPWEEAARLAQLPHEAASRALAGLICGPPRNAATPADSGTVAARLITLLPHCSGRGITAQWIPVGGPRVIQVQSRAPIVARAVLCVFILALLLLGHWAVVSHPVLLPARKPLTAPATVTPAVIPAPARRPDTHP